MTLMQILEGILILAFIAGGGMLAHYRKTLTQDLTNFLSAHHVKNAAGDATVILTALGMIGEQVVRAASLIPGLDLAGLLAQAEQDAAKLAGELGIPFTTNQIKSVVAASHQKVFGTTPTNG